MRQKDDNIFRSYEYIPWISAKHQEYRKLNGIGKFHPVDDRQFLKWLKGADE